MDLDPRRLRFLLAVARTGGVLAAAEALHMTPSAVSQQITRLERETRLVLITRTTHGSALTPEGQALAEAAQEIERTLATVTARIKRDAAEINGTVRLGSVQSFVLSVIAPSLPDWRRELPGVQFQIVESEREALMRSMKDGSLDAALIDLDTDDIPLPLPSGMTEAPLLDDPWKLVVPDGVLSADIAELSRSTLPWLGVNGSASARALSRLRRANDSTQPTVHNYYSMQVALALVAAGEGMAVVPALALQRLPQDGVRVLDLPGLGTRRIVLRSYPRGNQANHLVSEVARLLRESLQSEP